MRPWHDHALSDERTARLWAANQLIEVIASCGRQFFRHHEKVSYFGVSLHGKLLWVDALTGCQMHAAQLKHTKRFHEGHTLRQLVIHLRGYVMHGTRLPRLIFGPWPLWLCDGDLWGYGLDMDKVRETAQRLKLLTEDGA